MDFDLRKENPNYVIIWDLVGHEKKYKELFSLQEFYRTFMDYRLVIKPNLPSSLYDVTLVCIVCPWWFPDRIISEPVTPAIKENIHTSWKVLHTNHFTMKELSCYACVQPHDYHRLKYRNRIDSFHWHIAKFTNISLAYFEDGISFETLASLTHCVYLTPEVAHHFILRTRSPSNTISSSLTNNQAYKIFTVARKSLLLTPGIRELLASLNLTVWAAIIASGSVLVVLLNWVEYGVRYSSLLLSIYGPLTDQWTNCCVSQHRSILFLWGILCYSLTVLYGGELASSLAVLRPPRYPTS